MTMAKQALTCFAMVMFLVYETFDVYISGDLYAYSSMQASVLLGGPMITTMTTKELSQIWLLEKNQDDVNYIWKCALHKNSRFNAETFKTNDIHFQCLFLIMSTLSC